jgi:hypothetical protein
VEDHDRRKRLGHRDWELYLMLHKTLYRTVSAAALYASGIPAAVFEHDYTTTLSLLASETFSASGQRMMYDSTGKLTYGPNNMLTQSNTFSNAAWTKTNVTVTGSQTDPLGGSNASTLTAGAANATCTQTTAAFKPNGQNTLWIKRKTGSGTIELSKPDGTYTTVSVTSSWAQYTANYQGTGATGAFNIRIVTSGDEIYVYSASQAQVTYETTARSGDDVITTAAAYYGPRFDYNPSTLAARGLLLEAEAASNTVQYATTFTNFTIQNISFTDNSGTSPDGTNNAELFKTTATTGVHSAYRIVSPAQKTFSIYAKKGTANYLGIMPYEPSTAGAVFDLDAGTVSTTYGGSGYIESVGNGWYRCIYVATSTQGYYQIMVADTAARAAGISWTAAGTEDILIYGPQAEAGKYASSYIPNPANSTVTRAAETLSITTSGLGLTSAYTLVAEHDVAYGLNTSGNKPEYLNGVVGGANAFDIYWDTASTLGASVLSTVPTTYTSTPTDSTAAGSLTRYAFSVDSTQPKISINGAAATNIGTWSGTPRIPTSSINVGNYLSGNYQNPSCHYIYIAIYDQALTANLATLSA